MGPSKVSRFLGYRKLKRQKWIYCILIFGIVTTMGLFRADKLILKEINCGNLVYITVQSQRDLFMSKNCLFKPSEKFGVKVDRETRAGIKQIETNSHKIMKDNVEKNVSPFSGSDLNDKKLARELDEDIRAIVSAYVNKSNNLKAEAMNRSVVVRRELYSEIPPDYDDLIKVVMNTRDRCTNAKDYNAIIAVHSAAYNFENREAFRWLYGDPEKNNQYRFQLVFFVGLVKNSTLQDLLNRENQQFGDTVQGNFIDAYINMTYKAIMVFNWLDTHCKGIRGLFRVDDDVFMNLNRVYPRWTYVQRTRPVKTLMCHRLNNDRVLRTGKWAVPMSLIPVSKYQFMRCPGLFAAITVDLIHDMNVQSRKVPFFWIDDVVMLGIVPNAIGGVFFYPFNKWLSSTRNSSELYECLRRNGPNCPYLVGLTDVRNFNTMYGYLTGSIPTVNE